MRRIALSVMFFIAGLFTTWAAMFAGSHIPSQLKTKLFSRAFDGCYEIGPCSVPWWVSALLMAYIFVPSLIFAATGWMSSRPGVTPSKMFGRLLVLVIVTSLIYLAAYAVSG